MSEFKVEDLKIKPRNGGYARGQESLERILHAALWILIEEGAQALTMRRIAAKCGLKAGHLAYYFSSKEELLRDLFEGIVGAYEEALEAIYHTADETAEERLRKVIWLILEDVATKRASRIFPELWALSNHDSFVQERLDDMYRRGRVVLNDLIAEINPDLPEHERETLALFMSGSMEGMGIFAGFEKPWSSRLPWLTQIAQTSFIHLARTLRPGDMKTISHVRNGEPSRDKRSS